MKNLERKYTNYVLMCSDPVMSFIYYKLLCEEFGLKCNDNHSLTYTNLVLDERVDKLGHYLSFIVGPPIIDTNNYLYRFPVYTFKEFRDICLTKNMKEYK